MIRMLGGTTQPAQNPPVQEYPQTGNFPQGTLPMAGGYYVPAPGAMPQHAPYPSPPPAPALPPIETPQRPAPSLLDLPDDDDGKTRFISGVNIDKLNIPRQVKTLQLLASNGQWYDWGPIHAKGLNVGRAKGSADFPGLNSMAVRHMKFSYSRTNLTVEDLGSLNGTFVQVTQPVELKDGMRFRIGGQRFEFHCADAFEPIPRRVSEDGEEFCAGQIVPLAFLDLIQPDGKLGLRFPITKAVATILGREGPTVDIALTGDNAVSGSHAQIKHHDGTFMLEDMGSRNGTYVQIFDPHVVNSGDVILAGQVLFRVVDAPGL